MSDLSSLDLNQSIEKPSIIDTLRQPIWIALFTSVGIHAILGINLPKLSLFSEKAKLPPTVGLVELTPEQLELLPQPEEPEITFSTIPTPSNLSPISPPSPSELPFVPESSSSELPTIPVDPSDYNLPELPPEDSTTSSSSTRSRSTPSVSRLPRNPSPSEFSYNYPSTIPGRSSLPTTPISPPPLPSTNSQPADIFRVDPQQESNQNQIDEYQLRKNLNLTPKVYDSGLSRRPTLEIDPQEQTSIVENSTGESYSANLKLPPRRYQDKVENQIAIAPNQRNTNIQTEKKPIATATPPAPQTPPTPDPTKKGRLPEAPIVRQLREGKTIQDIAEETKQQQKVAVVTPAPTETNKSQLEVEEQETPAAAPTPKPSPIPETPKEFKGSLLEKFEQPQQQKVTATTPAPKPSPIPEENNVAAATVEETKPPTPVITPVSEPSPPTPEVKTTPVSEPSPPVQQQAEFKGSLLAKLQQQKQEDAAVTEESQSRDIALGAVGTYLQWAIELELEEDNLTEPTTIADAYPEAACEQKLEGKATVGVLVSPDGNITNGPKLLLESGHSVLDEAAIGAVNNQSFSSSDRSKLYQFEFNFDSSNCSTAKATEAENAPVGETSPTQDGQQEEGILIEVMPPEVETTPTE